MEEITLVTLFKFYNYKIDLDSAAAKSRKPYLQNLIPYEHVFLGNKQGSYEKK